MPKIMSVFEKLNLVEKASQETTNTSDVDNVNIEEKIKPKNVEEDNNEIELQYSESYNEDKKISNRVDSNQKSNLTINEIYLSHDIENSNVDTIFMLGNFINALPENLPHEVRKKSIISIINSSNMDLNKLISDGEKRLNILKQFSKENYDSTTIVIEDYKNQIAKLSKLISNYEEQIQVSENLLKEQNNIIKYETEKIDNIINFFSNND
ncbi:MAG: hypothetical protein ABF633_08360 [Clostridium sp.]|uniref:hypothetical protein n=1 Tax=Clostridium sp. TaxID=1506 RepID=UPI0039EAB9A7